jgi:hypothetical protein
VSQVNRQLPRHSRPNSEPTAIRASCLARGPAAALLLLVSTAAAAAEPLDAHQQLAGLFMQSCIAYAGNPAGLRNWARDTGLTELHDPARAAFTHGAPGQVFDASNPSGKFVVVSSDDGLCSVLTDQASGRLVVGALESDLTASGITYRMVIERDDARIPELHNREYLATKNGRSWRILAATVRDPQPGQAMLTAAPE